MYALPRSPMGRRALWILVPVLVYLVFPVSLMTPDSWRAVSISLVLVMIGLALASVVIACLAVFRQNERSVILIVSASLTSVLLLALAVGEALGGH